MVPFGFGVVRYALTQQPEPQQSFTWADAMKASFDAGEILIFSITILAPVAYVMLKFSFRNLRFADSFWFLLLIVLAIAFGSYIFSMTKGGQVKNLELVNRMALGFFLTSLILWYLSLIYNSMLDAYPRAQRRAEGKLASQLKNYGE